MREISCNMKTDMSDVSSDKYIHCTVKHIPFGLTRLWKTKICAIFVTI